MHYLFRRDTVLATISVFFVMWLFAFIPANMHFLDPIKIALTDIDFNDLSYSTLKSHRTNGMDDKIVIINIRQAGRDTIAQVINKLNNFHTRAIGLDVLFNAPKDPSKDKQLADAIKSSSNIVLSDKLEWNKDTLYHDAYFPSYSPHIGYVNFIGEEGGVIRQFSPFEKWKDTVNSSFAAAIVEVADAVQYRTLQKRKNDVEWINYTREGERYITIDYAVLLRKVDTGMFKDKIVLIGIADNNPDNIEDKHFTPLNERFAGKSIPDMNGVVLHANIISMIMENNYLQYVPFWVNWMIAFIVCWLFLAIVIEYSLIKHIWFHLISKTIQLVIAVLFIFAGIWGQRYLNTHLDFSMTLVAIAFSVDVLYFYEGFAKSAHRRFGYRTVFINSEHP